MTLALHFALRVARARRPIRRLLRDKRGISAVEFAMLLPLMVTLYLGGVEVSQAVAIDRKVTLVARSLGDLVAQATKVTQCGHDQHPRRHRAIIVPYSDSKLKITVSSVTIDGDGRRQDLPGATPRTAPRAPSARP